MRTWPTCTGGSPSARASASARSGPGATNLITAVADAFLDRSPLVAITGQGDLERMHKESHQYIDVVSMFKPVTKWNARLTSPRIIPEAVRKAFKVAQAQKPGPTHIELPEDVMAAMVDAEPLPARTTLRRPEPSAQELLRAAEVIRGAINPVVLAGNGVMRVGAAPALREFARATGIGVAETFMGKGLLSYEDPHHLGTVGLSSRDYSLAGFEDADVVITVGYDLVEHSPEHWNPKGDKTIVCIDTVAPEVDAHFITEVDLVGDLYHILSRLAEELRDAPHETPHSRLNDIVLGRFEAAKDDDAVPDAAAARAVGHPPGAAPAGHPRLRRRPAQAVDLAHVPRARSPTRCSSPTAWPGMGIALPTAIAAKLVHPDRHVVTVNGDGGFLMNVQELETAVRLRTPIVNVIWENRQYGSIVWKQDKKFGRHFGVDFTNPDFVKLADAFGMPAWRCESTADFSHHLRHALTLDLPSLIVLPIDYSIDVAISEELGTETVTT